MEVESITMKKVNHSMNLWLATALVLVSATLLATNTSGDNMPIDTSLTCNDLVQISLDENCTAIIHADMIVEGLEEELPEIEVEVLDETGLPVSMPVSGSHIGDTLYLIARHQTTGQSCWGRALIEDKWAPTLTCHDYQLKCFDDPTVFPLPDVWDNCDTDTEIILLSENIDQAAPCQQTVFTRSYMAIDESGNPSGICSQTITLQPPPLPSFPKDTTWSCTDYYAHPNIVEPIKTDTSIEKTGSGIPDVANGPYCPFNVVHTDFMFNNDCGNTFTILRTWIILNWCTDEIITIGSGGEDNVQLIRITDYEPPRIERPPFTVNANIGSASNEECGSTDLLLPPLLLDDCHEVSLRILTGIGEAIYINDDGRNGGYIPSPGLPPGQHTIIYEAQDECGNTDTLHVEITVADQTAPVPVCDELTNISLGISGKTAVVAGVFDDGSYDNCCLDSFLVSRMTAPCTLADTLFGDSVVFCCADAGDTVQVILRAVDCAGNTNDCMVLVEVEEKLPPTLESCPGDQIIDCEFYTNFLEVPLSQGTDSVLLRFGEAQFRDNCGIVLLENSFTLNLDQCLQGTITRRWRATDTGENTIVNCTQTIQVEHHSDWVVEFPGDVEVECGEELPPTGEPVIFFETCEIVAIARSDEILTVVPDVCFKIKRTWTAINWCVIGDEVDNPVVESPESDLHFDFNYDGTFSPRVFRDGIHTGNFTQQADQYGSQPDGVVIFEQEISVIDHTPPVVNCLPMVEICIEDTTCFADVTLPVPDILDCGISIAISATGDLGTGTGPFLNIPPGLYEMTYQVDDNCGNRGFCETEIEVRDCKKPTPFCKNGLIIEMENDSILVVNAEIFNDGSFDNCPGELIFSFSTDPTDTTLIFDCGSLGFQSVDVWLTDAAGNQDFCTTFVFIDDNNGVCAGLPLISGTITTPENNAIEEVQISLNNGAVSTMSDATGYYSLLTGAGEDCSLSAQKGGDPLNGVSTYDIVLITRHILGVQLLDSPYKIIAADANFSNTVTTSDIVTLRKLILQINTELPGGRSWRFVDKDFVFPAPYDPFATSFPEVLHFNNLTEDVKDADFIGIKIGDVN